MNRRRLGSLGGPSAGSLVILLLVVVPALTGLLLTNSGNPTVEDEPLTCSAERREFLHEIAASGELESSVNVEVCCEVRSLNSSWTRILEVIPEGSYVEPGGFLVRLDSSALENDLSAREILCKRAETTLITARNAYEKALSAKKEYLRGQFVVESQKTETKVFQAEERVRTAELTLAHSRQLAAKGYSTERQLAADRFTLQSAENQLRSANIARDVLCSLSKQKRLKELDSAVVVGKARVDSAEQIYRLNQEKLADIEEQIGKCVVRAPVAGQVVLAHLHHHGHSHMIEPGEVTREGRALVRIPDPTRMQVKAKIKEADVALVEEGMPVTIRLKAFPGQELEGHVEKVNNMPEPDSRYGPSIKQYETIVAVEPSSLPLRPGLTGELAILVNRLDDALLLPGQAVFRHGDADYCILLLEDGRWEARPVELGPNNGKFVIVLGGIEEGRRVVLDSATHRDKVELPELSAERAGATATPAVSR